MARPSNTIVLLPSATRTTSFTTNEVINIEAFTAARLLLSVSTVSGTSPTLDIYIQNGIRSAGSSDTTDGSKATGSVVWNDFAHFTQATTSNTKFFIGVVGGGNFANAAQDGALAAATVRNGPLGAYWRVKGVVAGTNPSFAAVYVVAEMIP